MPFSRGPLPKDLSPGKARLLVAEDNAALRDYLVAVMKAERYHVAAASTADDLIDTLAVSSLPGIGSGKFDLVIAEDRLVARSRNALVNGNWTHGALPPFVLIGSLSDRSSAAEDLGLTVVFRFGKPLDMEGLREVVRALAQHLVEDRQARSAGSCVSQLTI